MFKGSIVALITPFKDTAKQEVDFSALEKLVALHCKSGTSAIVPCGTTGESPTLDHEEHLQVVKEVVSLVRGTGVKVLAGTGSNSTKEAIQLTEQAAKYGVDGTLIVTPYYNKPDERGLTLHFNEINKIGVPLVAYNIPGRTGINLSPEFVVELATSFKNLVGVKASNGNIDEMTQIIKNVRKVRDDFYLLSGDDSLILPILSIGGVGVISVIANILPKTISELITTYLDKADIQTSKEIMLSIHELCLALLKFGPNPTPTKHLLNKFGYSVGAPRLPLTTLGIESTKELESVFKNTLSDLQSRGILYDSDLGKLIS
jgi:4-hydroxy-tetrahydrodipicolinate synthase